MTCESQRRCYAYLLLCMLLLLQEAPTYRRRSVISHAACVELPPQDTTLVPLPVRDVRWVTVGGRRGRGRVRATTLSPLPVTQTLQYIDTIVTQTLQYNDTIVTQTLQYINTIVRHVSAMFCMFALVGCLCCRDSSVAQLRSGIYTSTSVAAMDPASSPQQPGTSANSAVIRSALMPG